MLYPAVICSVDVIFGEKRYYQKIHTSYVTGSRVNSREYTATLMTFAHAEG